MSLKVGTRVVRGPDWKWKDQDNGEGNVGTVIQIGKGLASPSHQKIVVVLWDGGTAADYRAGYDGEYDLRVFDNASAGFKHNGVICDECKEADIAGIRWKCSVCHDFDLCSKCYMEAKHDLKHTFVRFEIPRSVGKLMTPRLGATQIRAKGLFSGAKVCRGRDWRWQEQDGGSGNTGKVIRNGSWSNTPRSAVAVRWDCGGAYEYRVGHDGKVDVRCVQAAVGGSYYKEHLPRFGDVDVLEVGDRVVVNLNKEIVKALQAEHGGWNSDMERYIGRVGKLSAVTGNGSVRIQYTDNQKWTFNPVAVTKLPSFSAGDKVRICSDLAKAKKLQDGHGGWASAMNKALGKEGRVLLVDSDGDVKVNVDGQFWTFNPDALTLVERGHGAEGLFEQDRGDLLVHLLKRMLDPLGIVDTTDFRDLVTAATSDDSATDPKEFLRAVLEGNAKKVSDAIGHDKDIVNTKVQGITALHLASFKGHLSVVQILTRAGAKLNLKDDEGDTPLGNAVYQDESKVVQYLLEQGADPNTVNNQGRSPLHIGTSKNHVECVRVLLKKGCNPNMQDSVGDTSLHDAIRGNRKEITELLLKARNIDLRKQNKKGFNPLHHAALIDNPHATRLIVKKDRSMVDIRKNDGYSALHLAVYNNHRNIVQILITEGKCAVDLYNDEHQTPLVLAVARGRTTIIEDLIDHGADVNSSDGDGDSCLHLAIMKHRQNQDIPDSELLKKFRKKYRDNGITTPLTALMCYLVQEGASVEKTNLKKLAALSYLKEAAVRRVLEHLARKRDRPEQGDSSLVEGGAERRRREENRRDSSVTSHSDDSQKSDPPLSPQGSVFDDSFCGIHNIKQPHEELKMGEMIGRGGFGTVQKGLWRGTQVAIKLISTAGSKIEDVEREVAVHKRALHPNIVQLMALGHGKDQAYVVMQLIDGKNLMDIIFKCPHQDYKPFTFNRKVMISRDVLSAMTYLHHCKILHLDIKPQNIIVEKTTHKPYLCDLGLAHIKTRCTMSQSAHVAARGTPRYMPPEGLDIDENEGEIRVTSASDVWSLACTFLELFTGDHVWPEKMGIAQLVKRFMKTDVTPNAVEKLDEPVKRILKPCFAKEPSQRPCAETMMQEFSGLI